MQCFCRSSRLWTIGHVLFVSPSYYVWSIIYILWYLHIYGLFQDVEISAFSPINMILEHLKVIYSFANFNTLHLGVWHCCSKSCQTIGMVEKGESLNWFGAVIIGADNLIICLMRYWSSPSLLLYYYKTVMWCK